MPVFLQMAHAYANMLCWCRKLVQQNRTRACVGAWPPRGSSRSWLKLKRFIVMNSRRKLPGKMEWSDGTVAFHPPSPTSLPSPFAKSDMDINKVT